MGRISEALKRAQRERARRQQSEAAQGAAGPPASECVPADSLAAAGGQVLVDVVTGAIPDHAPVAIACGAPIEASQIGPEVLALHAPGSSIAEKYRSVRTRLLTGNPAGSARVLAVSSAVPHEGKTVTVANLGFSLAELRHLRVALIDLDFRSRGLSRLLGVGGEPGMAEVLRGERELGEACRTAVRENLFVLPAGDPGSVSPSELLSGARAGAVFKEIHARFHYALLDTPPVTTVADIGLIAPLSHAVILVIRMHATPEPLLRRSVKMLQANRVNIAGCILAGYREDLSASEAHEYGEGGG